MFIAKLKYIPDAYVPHVSFRCWSKHVLLLPWSRATFAYFFYSVNNWCCKFRLKCANVFYLQSVANVRVNAVV